MQRWRACGVLLGVWLCASVVLAQTGMTPTHVVTAIEGEAQVQRATWGDDTAYEALSILDVVSSADQIVPSDGASVTVLCAGGGEIIITTPTTPVCEQSTPTSLAGSFLPGGLRGTSGPQIISPRLFITTRTPEFRWDEIEGASHYTLRIVTGVSVVWQMNNLPDELLPYPADQAPLDTGGTYTIEVISFDTQQNPMGLILRAGITVISDEERKRLDDELARRNLSGGSASNVNEYLKASLYAENRYYNEATKTMEAALGVDLAHGRTMPVTGTEVYSPNAYLLLGKWYADLQLFDLAQTAYQAALDAAEASGRDEIAAYARVALTYFTDSNRRRYCLLEPAVAFFDSVGDTSEVSQQARDLMATAARLFGSTPTCV